MSTTEFPFSDLVRRPTEVAAAAEAHPRVLLRRRGAPDLALARADSVSNELGQAAAFARLLAAFLPHISAQDLPLLVADVFPWTRYLPERHRVQFVIDLPSIVTDCATLGTFAPLAVFLAEWQDTATVYADPELLARLSTAIDEPLDQPVAEP